MTLLDQVHAGDRRALARLLSMVEDAAATVPSGEGSDALVVGLTGPPGAGKSTLTNGLIQHLRRGGKRVGVLAVDPSSPRSGGALLGDRVRMADSIDDPQVFIRSLASRGRLGGLADAIPDATAALELWRADVVLIETVGVGQPDVAVALAADRIVLVLTPQTGDEIQAAKAGVVEIADVIAVNKADLPGASTLAGSLRSMLALHDTPPPPIVETTASTGDGVADLWHAIDQPTDRAGTGARRRRAQLAVLGDAVSDALRLAIASGAIEADGRVAAYLDGTGRPGSVVEWLLERVEGLK